MIGIFSFSLNISESLFTSGFARYISAFQYDAPFMHQILQFFASLVFLLIPIMCIVLAIISFSKPQKLKLGLILIFIINILCDLSQVFADLLNPYIDISITEYFKAWFKYVFIGLPNASAAILYQTWILVSGIITKIILFILLIVVLNSKLDKEIPYPTIQEIPLPGQKVITDKFGLEDLEKLASLRDKGLISEEEFTRKRHQILDL